MEIWTGVTDASQTLKDRATQLLIKYKSGALVTQIVNYMWCLFAEVTGFFVQVNSLFVAG